MTAPRATRPRSTSRRCAERRSHAGRRAGRPRRGARRRSSSARIPLHQAIPRSSRVRPDPAVPILGRDGATPHSIPSPSEPQLKPRGPFHIVRGRRSRGPSNRTMEAMRHGAFPIEAGDPAGVARSAGAQAGVLRGKGQGTRGSLGTPPRSRPTRATVDRHGGARSSDRAPPLPSRAAEPGDGVRPTEPPDRRRGTSGRRDAPRRRGSVARRHERACAQLARDRERVDRDPLPTARSSRRTASSHRLAAHRPRRRASTKKRESSLGSKGRLRAVSAALGKAVGPAWRWRGAPVGVPGRRPGSLEAGGAPGRPGDGGGSVGSGARSGRRRGSLGGRAERLRRALQASRMLPPVRGRARP